MINETVSEKCKGGSHVVHLGPEHSFQYLAEDTPILTFIKEKHPFMYKVIKIRHLNETPHLLPSGLTQR